MEALQQTPVSPAPLPNLQAGLRIHTWLLQREFVIRAFAVLAGLGLVVAMVAMAIALVALRKRTQVVTLLPNHTTVLTEGTALEEAHELHEETAVLATTALLTRGPKGFDLAELLPRLFSKGTQVLAERLRQNEQAEFTDRQWQQKPSISRVEILETGGAAVQVHVTGHLVRSGPFAGNNLESVVPFSLRLALVQNPDFFQARRHPQSVAAFNLTYEAPNP